ncbi:DUF3872 domain-containing protein [Chitinophaga sp. 212800010-3]|nr:DUF3872 domain-containing protein [Chitinophaga sp. 212800010-3]MBN8880554.1 DUF3872 domain-containing protein [Sphingobacteriales bacterium]MBN9484410.1 DUF3872 domain-containing protein [Bacteroidota bacterium]MEC5143500.1 DUF3872 domain-containing protein [Chitinophaga sp. 212800010-3]
MKRLLNKSKFLWMLVLVFTSAIMLSSCDKDELEIQQNYPFEVKVMPVPADMANGQTVEIRITIQRAGNFSDAQYYIRYFQFEGIGALRYYNETPYLPNDLYPLPQTQFRLYYTSASAVSQSFDIWISDNFGNEKQLSFQFNSSD